MVHDLGHVSNFGTSSISLRAGLSLKMKLHNTHHRLTRVRGNVHCLVVIIELFSPRVTAETLRANVDSKLAF